MKNMIVIFASILLLTGCLGDDTKPTAPPTVLPSSTPLAPTSAPIATSTPSPTSTP